MRDLKLRAFRLFDEVQVCLGRGDIEGGMSRLIVGLAGLREQAERPLWEMFCKVDAQHHPLRGMLDQDPITHRSFSKPRGFAGDAVLLDLIYDPERAAAGAPTRLGAAICRWLGQQPSARAVRERRDLLTAWIDETAARRPGARVLSVASGHLREALRSQALAEGQIEALWALDQDPQCLEVVQETLGPHGVTPLHASVRQLLRGSLRFGGLDLIYAAGLYDYLPEPVAAALTCALFKMLRPGGRLVVANFAPGVPERGYMEACMGWSLVYRTEAEVRRFAQRIPPGDVARTTVYRSSNGHIIYLELQAV